MSTVTWQANPDTKEEKIKALILELVNDIEKEYGERYLTMGSAKIEEVVKKIMEITK